MISSEIFYQKLQAGQIHEALALVLTEASELDVTTRMTEVATNLADNSEYLRTKINLLTGEIHNEVGKDTIADTTSYIKLQQLHIDQIVVSHRLVQSYLDRVKAILTALDPSPLSGMSQISSQPAIDRLNATDLVARLTQTAATSPASTHPAAASAIDRPDLTQPDLQLTAPPAIFDPVAENIAKIGSVPIDPRTIDDDDLDLSIDPDGTIWEEWIEDEDFLSGSLLPPPSSAPPATIPAPPDWGRQLHPIAVKPTISRTTAAPGTTRQWDRFEPEYIDSGSDRQPPLNPTSDPHQLDRLLADLDR